MQQFLLAMALGCTVFSFAACPFKDQTIQCAAEQQALELSTYSLEQVEPLLPLLEDWTQRAFVQYPYLWLPPTGDYCASNVSLLTEENAQVALVSNATDVLGVAAVVALDSATCKSYLNESTVEKVKEQGFDPSKILYVSYFLTAPEHLNEPHIVKRLYDQIVHYAHQTGKTQVCFFLDEGKSDDPLRPQTLPVIEPWGHVIQGFRSMNFETDLSWPTMQADGTVRDAAHTVTFFVKDIE